MEGEISSNEIQETPKEIENINEEEELKKIEIEKQIEENKNDAEIEEKIEENIKDKIEENIEIEKERKKSNIIVFPLKTEENLSEEKTYSIQEFINKLDEEVKEKQNEEIKKAKKKFGTLLFKGFEKKQAIEIEHEKGKIKYIGDTDAKGLVSIILINIA
jgi:hypothetical protein